VSAACNEDGDAIYLVLNRRNGLHLLGSKLAWTERVVFNRSRSWHGAGRQLDGPRHGAGRQLDGTDRLVAPLGLKAGLDRTGRLQP
jgi:hypothetical protein